MLTARVFTINARAPKSVSRAGGGDRELSRGLGGGSCSGRLAKGTAHRVRMLAGCGFVGVTSSMRRLDVPDTAG